LIGLNHWMLMSFLVPMLVERGVDHGTAVLAASLVGPAQTAGRMVLMRFEAGVSTVMAIRWVLIGIVVSAVVLAGAGASASMTFGFAILQGAALGTMTILRPVWVAEVLGRAHFGQINGLLSIPSLGASALAPLFAAALFETFGPSGILLAAFVTAAAALALGLRLSRPRA
jgi:MFS family permease